MGLINKEKTYRVSLEVMTPYYTLVDASSEEEAIQIALDREAPAIPAFLDDSAVYEWVADGLMEFPNLPKGEDPYVEEY